MPMTAAQDRTESAAIIRTERAQRSVAVAGRNLPNI
jgi:hypothetical protein